MNNKQYFIPFVEDSDLLKEKKIAGELKKSRWWRNQCEKGVCYYCGKEFPPESLTMDHVIPLVRGGRSTKNNIVTACKECNNKKKYLLPLEMEGVII